MPSVPAWLLMLLALLSAFAVGRRQGFGASAPRLYIAGFYFAVWMTAFGDLREHMDLYAAISRYGWTLLFIADLAPELARLINRRRRA